MKNSHLSSPIFHRRKLRAFSLLSMVAIVIISGLMIFAMDEIERKSGLKIDFSFNAITSKSIQTEKVLKELDTDVHVYALFTPGQEDAALIGLLERYAASSKFFTFSIENLVANPALIHQISSSLQDDAITSDCLIVHGKYRDRTRILNFSDYVTQGYDMDSGQFYIDGLRYEQSLTEAILFVTIAEPTSIQMLSGHGELSSEDIASMQALVTKYNYSLSSLILSQGDRLDPQKLLMILSPEKDLSVKDLQDIEAFSQAGGALLFVTNYTIYNPMPNFESLLRSFGLRQKNGLVVAMKQEVESYFNNSPAVLIPYMEMTEPTASMILNKQTTLILAGAAAFDEPQKTTNQLTQYVVLRSGNAYLRDTFEESDNILQRQTDETGTFPLAILSDRLYPDGTISKAFIIGNPSIMTESWLYQNTYNGEFLLNIIEYLSKSKPIRIDIEPKEAIRPPLHITNYFLNYLLLIVIPLSVCIIALLVLIPRKKR